MARNSRGGMDRRILFLTGFPSALVRSPECAARFEFNDVLELRVRGTGDFMARPRRLSVGCRTLWGAPASVSGWGETC